MLLDHSLIAKLTKTAVAENDGATDVPDAAVARVKESLGGQTAGLVIVDCKHRYVDVVEDVIQHQ